MSKFTLTLVDADNQPSHIKYDSESNQFYSEYGTPLVVHTNDELNTVPYIIRVYTGKNCNARCAYCLQREHRSETANKMSIKELVSEIVRVTKESPVERIQLWGGEPLMYFNECKEYVNVFNQLNPDANYKFLTSTNGKLLTDIDIQKWIFNNIYRLQLSWDGPGQHLRGYDPLKNKAIVNFIKEMLVKDPKSVIFNPVMNSENKCLFTYKEMLVDILGTEDFVIGPARLLLPLDEQMAKYSITDLNELDMYATNLRNNIILGKLPQWNFIQFYVNSIWGTLGSKIITPYCAGELNNFMMVNQAGNILTCANIDIDSVDEYGHPTTLGHISTLEAGTKSITDFHGLTKRRSERCKNCIVYSACNGGCPRIPSNLLDTYCLSRVAELLPVYVAILHAMTGKILTNVRLDK